MLSWRFMIGCQFCSASSCVHKHNAVWVSYPCNQFYPPIELRLEKFTQYFKTHINFLCHYPLLSLSPPFALQALSFFAFPPFWFQRCNYPWQTTGSDPRFVSIHHRNICIPPLLFRFRVSLFFFCFFFRCIHCSLRLVPLLGSVDSNWFVISASTLKSGLSLPHFLN